MGKIPLVGKGWQSVLESELEIIGALLEGFDVVIVDSCNLFGEKLLEAIRDRMLRLEQEQEIYPEWFASALNRMHLCHNPSSIMEWENGHALIITLEVCWTMER